MAHTIPPALCACSLLLLTDIRVQFSLPKPINLARGNSNICPSRPQNTARLRKHYKRGSCFEYSNYHTLYLGFSVLTLLTFLVRSFLSRESVQWGGISPSTSSLCSPRCQQDHPHPSPPCPQLWQQQMFSDIDSCPVGGKIGLVENHRTKAHWMVHHLKLHPTGSTFLENWNWFDILNTHAGDTTVDQLMFAS